MPLSERAFEAPVEDHLLGVYARAPLAFARGEGVRLYTEDGDAYLDFLAGIAVNALGHAHPVLLDALTRQAGKVWHVSNIFRIPEQERLAARLCELSFADVVFFTNSGAEAVECALKMARKHHAAAGRPERDEIIGFQGAFHGRTYATINAAGNPTYVEGFGPILPGYVHVPFADLDAVKAAIGPKTAAVIIEPVQGEGGAKSADGPFLRALRALCDEHGVLLIFDEVQCGLGRTGKLFAYEHADAVPDIMALAKALGGGFPVGACLASKAAASGMGPGAHGSTYGGNPLAMAVALAAVNVLADPELLDHVTQVSGYFKQQLEGLRSRHPDVIEEIRGKGLLVGVKLRTSNRAFMEHARAERLLIAGGGENCIRLLPPLIVAEDEIREAIEKLEAACVRARAAEGPSAA
jgi:acetylornithine/N-succinyldiaminopimelate aminotransferase